MCRIELTVASLPPASYHFACKMLSHDRMEESMAQLLVRDLDPKLIGRLKKKAKDNRRSLQGEVKVILEQAAEQMTMAEFVDKAAQIRKRLKGRRFSDSTDLIREDRDSR
jgi:plasmid stability protein